MFSTVGWALVPEEGGKIAIVKASPRDPDSKPLFTTAWVATQVSAKTVVDVLEVVVVVARP